MYSKTVLNIFNNPANTGRISKPDGIADCYNQNSTAHVEFSLRIESGVILDCKFRAQANPYIVAICSTITTMLKGKMCSMVFLDPYSIKTQLGDESDVDITFCIDCVKLALQDYKEKLEKELKISKKKAKETLEIDEETSQAEENREEISEESVIDEQDLENIADELELDEEDEDFIPGLFDFDEE